MEIIQQLVLVYAGTLLINLVLSGLLWFRHRSPLHRQLFLLWAAGVIFFLAQGIPVHTPLGLAMSGVPAFLSSYALAQLLALVAGFTIRKRLYLSVLGLAVLSSFLISKLQAPFWAIALPTSIAVALPALDTPLRALFRRDWRPTMMGKAALISALALGLHDLDFAFLRDKPQFAVTGFTVALLITFAISICAPATVLEVVTEERMRAHQQNEVQRRFFANITHELRTPLTMILAPLEGMLAGEFGPVTTTQRNFLEAGRRNGLRLLKLINDLLELAKLEDGFMQLTRAPIDVPTMLTTLVADARPLAASKNLEINLVMNDVPQVVGDAEKLERVLINLIANALKFTDKGQVTVRVGRSGGEATIAVEDTGVGISSTQIPQLFQRFNQGDGSVTRRHGGTGIGLAYAKEIVELHGGHITAENIAGAGSRFVVHLPESAVPGDSSVSNQAVGAPASSAQNADKDGDKHGDEEEPRAWARRIERERDYRFAEATANLASSETSLVMTAARDARILLVEDNAEIVDLIRHHLGGNHVILVARNGEEGLELARRERPALIITDVMMPKMDGLSMMKALREDPHLADVAVIMLTSRNQLEDRLAGREAGADVYLSKPFSPRELQAAVTHLLQRQGQQVQSLVRAHVEGLEIVSAGLAHEIQNPLNVIKNAQLLIEENVDKLRAVIEGLPLESDPVRAANAANAQQKINRMVISANRGLQRIEDVVSLMRRYAREGYPTEPADVSVDQAVTDVVELVAPKGDVQCDIELQLGTSTATVRAVPEDLNQVIRSLVQNALESLERAGNAGRITVRTRAEQKHLVLEVSDNGPGISSGDMNKIFSPFYSTKGGPGRGLGLPIVQVVVTRAGGSVDVTSTPQKETTFRVRLPLSSGVGMPPSGGRTSDRSVLGSALTS
jgi:signal transduction histidine kinase